MILAGYQSVFAQYTIEVNDRHQTQEALQQRGIPTAVHYPLGLHQQPILQKMFPHEQSFPNTEYAARRVMSLPMHPYLTEVDKQKIGVALTEALEQACEKITID